MTSEIELAKLTRELIHACQSSVPSAVRLLNRTMPSIKRQVTTDALRGGPLSFWGRSRNHDEFADARIVPAPILQLLATFLGKDLSLETPHAGIQHCYGYLFSNLETPYGFKRSRWIETGIEESFGLSLDTLGPDPQQGTLLANATYFTGMIAFRGNSDASSRLRRLLKMKVAQDLTGGAFLKCPHFRLSEQVRCDYRSVKQTWTLQTDVVQATNDFAVLAYSVKNHKSNRHELITLFPVDPNTAETIKERGQLQHDGEIRPRYNAYVPALQGRVFSGRIAFHTF